MIEVGDATPHTEDELDLVDRVLESWAAWSRGGSTVGKVDSVALYNSEAEASSHALLPLSDDQLTDVDRVIAKLSFKYGDVIDVHYRLSYNVPMKERFRRMRLSRADYMDRLQESQSYIYDRLMPDIEHWRTLF